MHNRGTISHPLTRAGYVCALVASIAGPVRTGAANKNPIEALTGAPAKVAWCQEHPDSVYTLACYSTLDNRGEHLVFDSLVPGNYPLITRDGSRIVYSVKEPAACYVGEWDGANGRELGVGIAVDYWADPASGSEWVYVVPEYAPRSGPVVRRRLDDPSVEQTVWNKTETSYVFFVVSGDGTRAAGTFPWQEWGVANLTTHTWEKFGIGCFPSIAPDNSYRSRIFDGFHRNLTLYDSTGAEHAVVNINDAPGIKGWEVYFPRWSNNPRIMTMTGPYSRGGTDSCAQSNCGTHINKAGDNVEVYLGRFNAQFTDIEHWVQLTDNRHWDSSPDVWVQPSTPIATPRSPRTNLSTTPRPAPRTSFGPGGRLGLHIVSTAPGRHRQSVFDIRGRRLTGSSIDAAGLQSRPPER